MQAEECGSSGSSDSCSGYYECGGGWQYCEGYTCSADSDMCSEYCEDESIPISCIAGNDPCICSEGFPF
ncbi:MAG: hypothetical protein E7012_02125 [Alphaproteobacteria bacterium]|nr:hypothetical protein [Alphaproteobacteria bacterium]